MNIGETEPERSTGIDLASCGLAPAEPLGPTMAPFVTGELVGLLDAWDSLTDSWSRADIAATRTAIRRVRGNLSTMRPMLDDTWVDEIRSSLKMFGQGLSQVCQRDAVHDLADEFLDRHRVHSAVHACFEASATDRAAMMAEAREVFVGPNGTQTRNALARAVERNIPLRTESDADTWKPCRDVLPGLVLEPWREMRRAARIDEHGYGLSECVSRPATFATPPSSSLRFWVRSPKNWDRTPARCNTSCVAIATPPRSWSGRTQPRGTITR